MEKLLVSVGEEIQAGQVVAVLDTHRGRSASIQQFRAMVAVAEARLVLVKAGPKLEDVRAQEAVIRAAEADLADAEANFERSKQLVGNNAISRVDFETSQLRRNQSSSTLEEERAKLEAMKVIRPEDVQVAEAELAQAKASLAVGEEDLRNTEVRSPIAGRILRIHARPGESVGDSGVLDVGDTSSMHVITEVYEGDIDKVREGQSARVRVPTLGENVWLTGEVVSKDLLVARQDLFDNDPVADVDSRVVEVRIRLSPQDSARVAGVSNARAEVIIDVSGESA